MYVHSVKLLNYKSMGNYDEAEVILEERITAIIGKNESGKSNVLDGLSRVNFLKKNQSAFADDLVNRNCPTGTQIVYIVTLKPNGGDSTLGITSDSQVEITKTQAMLSGGLLTYYQERPLREFCVSDFRQNQEYHIINVQDEGLFPLSTPVPEGWDGMRAVCGVNAGAAFRESYFRGISLPCGRRT